MFGDAVVGAVEPTLTVQQTTWATFKPELDPFLGNRSRYTGYPVLGGHRSFLSGPTPYRNHPTIDQHSHLKESFSEAFLPSQLPHKTVNLCFNITN